MFNLRIFVVIFLLCFQLAQASCVQRCESELIKLKIPPQKRFKGCRAICGPFHVQSSTITSTKTVHSTDSISHTTRSGIVFTTPTKNLTMTSPSPTSSSYPYRAIMDYNSFTCMWSITGDFGEFQSQQTPCLSGNWGQGVFNPNVTFGVSNLTNPHLFAVRFITRESCAMVIGIQPFSANDQIQAVKCGSPFLSSFIIGYFNKMI